MSIVQLHPNVSLGVSYLLIYVDSSTCTHDWIRSDLVGPRKLTRRAETVPSRPAPLVRCGYEEGTGTGRKEGRRERRKRRRAKSKAALSFSGDYDASSTGVWANIKGEGAGRSGSCCERRSPRLVIWS